MRPALLVHPMNKQAMRPVSPLQPNGSKPPLFANFFWTPFDLDIKVSESPTPQGPMSSFKEVLFRLARVLGELLFVLIALALPAQAGTSATLAWDPSSESVAGYRLHYGNSS